MKGDSGSGLRTEGALTQAPWERRVACMPSAQETWTVRTLM